MTQSTNPIATRSKKKIAAALTELMKTESFDKISVKDIVEKAGLTRQTFYHNFSSKDDVIRYKVNEQFDEMLGFIVDRKMMNWEEIIWFYFRYWQRNEDFLKLLIRDNLVSFLEEKSPEYFAMFHIIQFDDNEFGSVQYDYAYSFITGAMTNLLITWVTSGQLMDAKSLTQIVLSIIKGEALGASREGELPEDSAVFEKYRSDGENLTK